MKYYPEEVNIKNPIELKLGIKSSFGQIKAPIALIYFLWASNDKPDELEYTKEIISDNGDQELVLSDEVYSNLEKYLKNHLENDKMKMKFKEKIENNLILTSQIESIKVAFELIWKLGAVFFCDENLSFSSERQNKNNKKVRYNKKIRYSSNIDLLELLISQKRDKMEEVLFLWLLSEDNDSVESKDLIRFFTNISDDAIYRIRVDDDNEIKFNMSGVYSMLAKDNIEYVELSDVKETMGSLRILNSILREDFNIYLHKVKSSVKLNDGTNKKYIEKYANRVSTRFDLENIDLSEIKKIDKKENIDYEQDFKNEFNKLIDITLPHQRMFFGAPGTGKSFKLNQEAKEFFGTNYERVTFHPNYMYGNFVGAFKPFPKVLKNKDGRVLEDDYGNTQETITYKYIPGPLMRTLVKALKNRETNYLVLIEEINRANVAAVFGDFFQLLDRKENGESEYAITTSEEVKKYLERSFLNVDPNTREYISSKIGSEYERLILPRNLYIWSTMNSADQGVMPMDTAFKRRWEFTYIGIDDVLSDAKIASEFNQYRFRISKSTTVKWNDFRTEVNKRLSSCGVPEDKLLGPYFISRSVLESDNMDEITNSIKNKVLMYIYEDAGKPYRGNLFVAEKSRTYSALCKNFDEDGKGIFIKPLEIEEDSI